MALNQLIEVKAEQARKVADQRTNRLIGSTLHLFTSATTVTRDTVIGDFAEAAWTGYASQTLTNWTAAAELGDGIHAACTDTDSPTFTNASGSPQTFTGYFVVSAGGDLMSAANTGAVTIPDGGAEVVVVQFTERSEFASSP